MPNTSAKPPFTIRTMLLFAALLQIVWGIVPSASQVVIDEIPVELYISMRWTISAVILFVFIFWKSRWIPKFSKETFLVALLGIGAYAIGSFGTLYGLKLGGVTNFALMTALSPITTSTISFYVLRERPNRLFFIALPTCILGLFGLVLGKHALSSWSIALSSSALIIGADVFEAIIFTYSKKMKSHFTSLQFLAISQGAAALFSWSLQLCYFHQSRQLLNLSLHGWSAAIFVSVVACVLLYAVLYWLLSYIDGHRLALFDGLHTVSATTFGIVFFHESLNGTMLIGGLLLLIGLVLGNLGFKTHAMEEIT